MNAHACKIDSKNQLRCMRLDDAPLSLCCRQNGTEATEVERNDCKKEGRKAMKGNDCKKEGRNEKKKHEREGEKRKKKKKGEKEGYATTITPAAAAAAAAEATQVFVVVLVLRIPAAN